MKKLSLSLLCVVLTAAIGLGWTLDNFFAQMDSTQQQDNKNSEFDPYRQMGTALAKTLDSDIDALNVRRFLQQWPPNSKVQLSLIAPAELPLPKQLQANFTQGEPLELESEQDILIHFLLPNRQQILILSIPKLPINQNNDSLRLLFTSMFYLGILSLVLVWLYPLINHLHRLRISARALGEGKLEQRVNITRTSYIADIEIEFNRMAQRIQTLVEDNKLLGNAVSHDLRTPLARLRFGIEALQQTDNPDNREKYQQHISRDIEEMEKLVAVLLNYARMDQALIEIQQGPVNLSELTSQCVALQDNERVTISCSLTKELYVTGDGHYLAMLINNLLDNALEHGRSQVLIELTDEDKNIYLKVSDDGAGIAEHKRLALLKPFTRGESSKPSKSGYGMGLAIVNRIAQWHKAELSIHTSPTLGGAEIAISFNRAKTS